MLTTAGPIEVARPARVLPAGWYLDTTMVGTQRYWDGSEWTSHVAPATATTQFDSPTTLPATRDSMWVFFAILALLWLLAYLVG